jgi:MFS family permease
MIAAAFFGSTVVTPLYALYQHEFGFSKIVLTLIYAIYVVGNLFALFFFGRLSDQIGRRKIALASMVLAAVAVLFFLTAHGTAALYAARLVGGLAVGVGSGTGAAWLAELYGPDQRPSATVMATAANMAGIAIGPLIGGLLAQFAPAPLILPFVVNLLVIALAVVLIIVWPQETVQNPVRAWSDLNLRPRIGVPKDIRARFIAPAVSAFATFALTGFYFALIPSVLRESLHNPNPAVAGCVVFEMVGITVVSIFLTRAIPSQPAMMAGLIGLIPSCALMVTAQMSGSMPLLLIVSAIVGVVYALGYRGGLQVVNEIAPDDRRAEVASSYFLACFAGNSVPVIGVGVLSAHFTFEIASAALAAMIVLLALFALIVGVLTSRASSARPARDASD